MTEAGVRHRIVAEDLAEILESGIDFSLFAGKTVAVAGANGFLPAYMVECLLRFNELNPKAKIRVFGWVRNLDRARERFAAYQGREDLVLLKQTIGEPVSSNFKENLDFLIHAASQASPKYYGVDPVGTLLPNSIGTYHLLEYVKSKPLKGFLFFSSGEVYGEMDPTQIPIKEARFGHVDPAQIRSCYAESKRMGETLCVSYAHQFGVPTRIVRPFHTYGPGMRLDDGRVFSDFVANILDGKNIEMKSDGSAIRPYCYLADAVRGFFTVLLQGKTGEAYNIGNDRTEVSVLRLAEILVGLFPEKRLSVIRLPEQPDSGYLKSSIKRNCPDLSKVQALGWSPKYSIEKGFTRTVESFL